MTELLISRRVGEVVESTSTSFIAQCYQLDGAPGLGALVRTDSPDIYGVVAALPLSHWIRPDQYSLAAKMPILKRM
ncbi:MAG: hypothetical protein CM1200mP27_08860 [Chloroflexota bacterium]|nr:MAG: hypothetical protein CM1200mP27_08860 [Chloroflexota bacterium]